MKAATMQTLQFRSQAGEDGILHLDIPSGIPHAEFEVVVVLQPRIREPQSRSTEDRGWPPGFFEETAGAWQGDFVRDQGQFEERDEF
jgi:hypothetical protein